MVPGTILTGRFLRRAGLFLSNRFYAVAEPITYRNQKAHFVSPSQPDCEAAVKAVADLDKKAPIFCRVGDCRYWHTDPKRVERHRDNHFQDRHVYLCPNQTGTCPALGGTFKRRDAVGVHCKRNPVCRKFLEANEGIISRRRVSVTEEELRPHDPDFHKPYETFDGRTGRSDAKVSRQQLPLVMGADAEGDAAVLWQQQSLVMGIDAEGTP